MGIFLNNMPKAMFYLLKGDYRALKYLNLDSGICNTIKGTRTMSEQVYTI